MSRKFKRPHVTTKQTKVDINNARKPKGVRCSLKRLEQEFLYLYLEVDRWEVIPKQLQNIYRYLAVTPYCDQSFQIFKFPMEKFSSLQEVRNYVEPIKSEADNSEDSDKEGFDTTFAGYDVSKKLPEFLEHFCRNWGYINIQGENYKFDNGFPYKLLSNKIKANTGLLKDLRGIQNIYTLYLPSGDIEFEEINVICWDGNEHHVTARDSQFWYYIWWAGS